VVLSEENRSDEISLLDLLNVLWRYKSLLIGLPILGAVSAVLLVSLVLQPTWEALLSWRSGR
jgi:LPS O-antigen subunit length determinant protein (WzzB/FepE family)